MGEMNRAQHSDFDLSQFYAVFFEEAGENLESMEGKLLAIDVAAAGDDELNAIFRVAHSIKGGAATFGFSDVTELTHELETLLDRVRRHEFALTRAMIDVLLEAGDVLRAQLARYQGSSADSPDTTDLVARIRRLAAGAAAGNGDDGTRHLEVRLGPLADGALADGLAELFRDIPSLGTFEPLDGGRLTDGYRRFKVVTKSPDNELIELFSFHVAREQIAIAAFEPDRQDESKAKARTDARDARADAPRHPDAAVEGDGFGFFVDPATLPPARPAGRATEATCTAAAKKSTAEKSGSLESTTLRVSVEKVDQLINLVGELVIAQSMLTQQAKGLDPVHNPGLLASVSELERSTRHLQEAVLSIRMIPMSFVFNRFPRLIRDLAAKLGKNLELKLVGEATELDKGLIEKIIDPLTHLVRNSADHGIELPEQRVAAGKPATGTITLAAVHRGGSILIEVKDDGAGLKRDRILAKARERGLPVRDDMSDPEVWALIWEPGFSTADQLSDVSGRGVGMDVVRRNIAALGGTVELDSAQGYGTRVSVRLPLTLAIMDGMSIGVGGETYILPLASVVESFQIAGGTIQTVGGSGRVVKVRDEYLPVLPLAQVFSVPSGDAASAPELMVIVEAEGQRVALIVDELLGQHQVVVKNLEANYRRVPNVSGATILGDGRVALIIDVASLVKRARH
jgi:two-component system chemotaxis sensor kinase CheA